MSSSLYDGIVGRRVRKGLWHTVDAALESLDGLEGRGLRERMTWIEDQVGYATGIEPYLDQFPTPDIAKEARHRIAEAMLEAKFESAKRAERYLRDLLKALNEEMRKQGWV